MDDSDQDFVDLCSKLLKRPRKKPGEPRQHKKAKQQQPSSQASDGDRKRRNNKRDGDSRSKCAGTQPVGTGAGAGAEQHAVCRGAGSGSGDPGSSGEPAAAEPRAERAMAAKDKVLRRMQQFKRATPQKMVHKDKSQTTNHEHLSASPAPPPLEQRQDPPQSLSSVLTLEPQDSDEALALRLQQELDREAAEVQTVDLEDGGLYFCQICQRDLSHMTPKGRSQHLNRCLDETEESVPTPPPPPPPASGVPDCPICGKKFKSQKSRSTHLKRCSSDMGVPPAVLLEALQRQAEEIQNAPAASTHTELGGTKRKGPAKPSLPAGKKPRTTREPLDEDTMVALALSSSLLEQERDSERVPQTEMAASHVTMTSVMKWRPDAGKGRGKRKKGAVPRPPPLLLVQDADAALRRLQERVSALLLRTRPPSPPTPTRCPSTLPGWSGAAPLWQMSTLPDGGSTCVSDFYTPELREFITPWEPATADPASSSSINKPESLVQPVSDGTPVTGTRASILPSSSQTAASSPAPSTPGTGQLPVGSQTLRDLMELAEDGMTLTQYSYTTADPDREKSSGMNTNFHLSGFVPEESEERADLCASGFLPESTHTCSDDTHSRARRSDKPGPDKARGSDRSVALSKLASDLRSMVNNPQLSDVQLQVDSGEVYFAHSFMVYARCPLLAEMVHESGFGVQEEGMPAAQRVLLSDIPGQAVFALLQYLYTAHCSIPASLQPDLLELASRFDLQELQLLCELQQENAATDGDEDQNMNQDENVDSQTDQAFMELLRSMWNEENEDNEGVDTEGGSGEERGLEEGRQADDLTTGDREICEDKVNEEELEEIYEFAATQRKREEEDSMKEEEEEEEDGEEGFAKLAECKGSSTGCGKNQQLDSSLDRSYSRLFSDAWGVYEEDPSSSLPSTSGQLKTQTLQSQKQPSNELSGRTLLQSSASVVGDLSLSPPPSASNLPVAGQSPGKGDDRGTDAADTDAPNEDLLLKQKTQGPRNICVSLSPPSPPKKTEPELIVLSDSSEEMEVVLSSRGPSPDSPDAIQNLQSYTHIKSPPAKPNKPTTETKKSSSLELSPDDLVRSHPSSVNCSPEVSWLIPSTPLQHGCSSNTTNSSSTQTRSSMCRTRLFPKSGTSSHSGVSSPVKDSDSPTRLHPTEVKEEEMAPCISTFDLNSHSKITNDCDVSKVKGVFAAPVSQSKLFSSKQDTPLHPQLQPYSSTPLHTDLHQPPAILSTSPLHSNLDKQRPISQEGDSVASESLEKTELGSFHLSPLSEPSDPTSSSSHRGLQSSQRRSNSSQGSNKFRTGDNTGSDLTRREIRDHGGGETKCDNEGETAVGEVADSSFQQSFMYEPPIAFNDSWGLDVCPEANPGCFSLRLEDSTETSRGRQETAGSSSSTDCQPSHHNVQTWRSHGSATACSPSTANSTQPSMSVQADAGRSFTPSPPDPNTPEINNSLLDSKIWDSWEEEEEEALPLSQRVNPSAQLKTPAPAHNKRHRALVPITPMPHYSDMDTPELKNKLNRFGVRPLPKRQMVLKLKEIHQYTHQLVNSDSEDELPSVGRAAQMKPPSSGSVTAGKRPLTCNQTVKFKEPRAPATTSPLKHSREEEAEPLSASQGSNTSSTAASEESERSNPELCLSSDCDSDSDGGISASQSATRLQDRLQAVRSLILSDSELYTQILQYQPLVLSHLQGRLKAAGIRLGAAKLVDYLDSQCITFTTAKPGQSAPSRRRGKKTGKGTKAAGERGRKRGVTAAH